MALVFAVNWSTFFLDPRLVGTLEGMQILSTMADIASYKDVCEFIPGLTNYLYSIASLHRLQYGPGAPMPVAKTTRLRVDRCQLDYFLGFVTSPHLVQDLPFGENVLHLSDGGSVTVPNVIRTMIPQRSVQQYKLLCAENGFKPFSESTMLRVLAACSASVRKSVQGLDYYAAEGSRAFEDLAQVVRMVSALSSGQFCTWEKDTCDALKAGKMYLKGDYKVILCQFRSLMPSIKTCFCLDGNNVKIILAYIFCQFMNCLQQQQQQ